MKTLNHKTRKLMQQGKETTLRSAPEPYALALVHYMAIDGEAWEVPQDFGRWMAVNFPQSMHTNAPKESRMADFRLYQKAKEEELLRNLPYFRKKYSGFKFGIVDVPMATLIPLVMAGGDLPEDWQGDFAKYHEWYVSQGWMPDHDITKSLWPVILDDEHDEIIQDGWHRFHDYYRKGVEVVPCLYYLSDSDRINEKYYD